jgi:hypothetical protein
MIAPTKAPAESKESKALKSKFSRKVWRVSVAIWASFAGVSSTVLYLRDPDHVLDQLATRLNLGESLLDGAQRVLQFLQAAGLIGEVDYTRRLAAVGLNLIAVLLLLALGLSLSSVISNRLLRQGEFHAYGRACVRWTRGSKALGWLQIYAGVLMLLACWLLPLRFPSLARLPMVDYLPAVAGLGLALIQFGRAVIVELGFDLGDPDPLPAEPAPEPPEARKARATGEELLLWLRQSPLYRRQVYCDFELGGAPFATSDRDGIRQLVEAYPRIRTLLPATAIETLTNDQTEALEEVLKARKLPGGERTDFAFVGWPGSGRSTLTNLLAMSSVLHREGAVYCVTPESPTRSVDLAGTGSATVRHPITQIRHWLEEANLDSVVRLEEAYAESVDKKLNFERRPDMLFTDVSMLSRSVLSKVRADATSIVGRLRYVIIDHPHRLSREDLVRLRIAISRLRMTTELIGRSVTFIVILPRLNNFMQMVKYLLNNDYVSFHEFSTWPRSCQVIGWVPPLEILDPEEDQRPLIVRASFTEEVVGLLSELGYLSNHLDKPLRMAIIDAIPLLGPEAREHIRSRVSYFLGSEVEETDEIEIRGGWIYFATSEIAIDYRREFDVIVCLGTGDHPAHLISCLRMALADSGVLFLIGDSSAADIESLRQISEHAWDPGQAILEVSYPSVLLPDHSEAVIAHELAALFEDFHGRPIPRERLIDVFPGEHTPALLTQWEYKFYIEPILVFDTVKEGSSPEIRPYLRCTDASFGAAQYEVPWGCCNRRVYRVYDEAARRHAAAGQHLNEYLDEDRLFIDFFPYAVLRYPPNTVLVRGRRLNDLLPDEQKAASRRYVNLGDVLVIQQAYDASIGIDRRAPRIATRLLDERLLVQSAEVLQRSSAEDELADPIAAVFQIRPPEPIPGEKDVDEQELHERRSRLSEELYRPVVVHGANRPALQLVEGSWICRIEERLRDLAKTGSRLVEEHQLTEVMSLQRAQKYHRVYETVALNLFIESTDAGPERDELGLDSYAAHHGFARTMAFYLRRLYFNFDTEFRIAVVPNRPADGDGGPGGGISAYRIVIYRLRRDELGAEQSISWLLQAPGSLRSLLEWVVERLESCDCKDGCSRCCGGLGSIPEKEMGGYRFEPEDAVSRYGAYLLGCRLLGRGPNDRAYYGGKGLNAEERMLKPTGTKEELGRIVGEFFPEASDDAGDSASSAGPEPQSPESAPPEREVPVTKDIDARRASSGAREIVTTAGEEAFEGLWMLVFGLVMPFPRTILATVRWLKDLATAGRAGGAGGALASAWDRGFYVPKKNVIYVSQDRHNNLLEVKETLIHEFTHNWQFKSGEFDRQRHQKSAEAKRYFDGKLVVEGHAMWAEHQYRFFKGLAPVFYPNDRYDWNEYKVGYFLIEGIEKAVGQQGLFRWLGKDPDTGGSIRSRNPLLRWDKGPFTLTEALQALDLLRFARGRYFSEFDVVDPDELPTGGLLEDGENFEPRSARRALPEATEDLATEPAEAIELAESARSEGDDEGDVAEVPEEQPIAAERDSSAGVEPEAPAVAEEPQVAGELAVAEEPEAAEEPAAVEEAPPKLSGSDE